LKVREKEIDTESIMVTLKIAELAMEAADPELAGRKMRQVFFSLDKLTNRQLTVDSLEKMKERKVGTHEIERLAMQMIKGETRRNPEIVEAVIKIKLEDARRWVRRKRKKFLMEKADLYTTITRVGLIKEEFWTTVKAAMEKKWTDGKKRIQEKVDRLERVYKGPVTETGMVGNIRVGDRELEEEEEEKKPVVAGVTVTKEEAKVLNLDPRFRDWSKINMEDIETDIDVCFDNLRREIRKAEENDGKTFTVEEEEAEKVFTKVLDYETKTVDFGKQRSTAMKNNKNFVMAQEVNNKDETILQRAKNKMMETSKRIIKKTNDDKGFPRTSTHTEEEMVGIKRLVRRRKEGELVVSSTDKSQACGAQSEEEWKASLAPHMAGHPVVPMAEVDTMERQMTGAAIQVARALGYGEGHGQGDRVRENLKSEHVSIPVLTAKIKDHKEVVEGEPVKVRPVCGVEESPNGQLSNILSEVVNIVTKFEDKHETECRSSEELRASIKEFNSRGLDLQQEDREGGAARGLEGEEERGAAQGLEEQQPAWKLDSKKVIGSSDFKSYYPTLPVRRAASQFRQMVEETELEIKTDTKEGGDRGAGPGGGGADQAPQRRGRPGDHLQGDHE